MDYRKLFTGIFCKTVRNSTPYDRFQIPLAFLTLSYIVILGHLKPKMIQSPNNLNFKNDPDPWGNPIGPTEKEQLKEEFIYTYITWGFENYGGLNNINRIL